jgi:hypothetical protein
LRSSIGIAARVTGGAIWPTVPVVVVGTIQADDAGGHFLDPGGRHDGATTLSRHEAIGHLTAHARHWSAWALCLAATGLTAVLVGVLLTA